MEIHNSIPNKLLGGDKWLNSYAQMISQDFVTNGVQHTQKKQLEIVQAHDKNKNLQVVRAEIQIRGFSSSFDTDRAKITKPTSLNYLFQNSNPTLCNVNDFCSSKYGKSTSDENLSLVHENDSGENAEWNRVSRIRRSLQLQRPPLSESSYSKPSISRRSINVLSVKQAFEDKDNYLDKETKHKINDFVALNSILADSKNDMERKDDFNFTRKTFEPLESTRNRFKKMYERSLNNFEEYKKDGIKNIHESTKDYEIKKEINLDKGVNQICTVENNDNSSMTIIKIINQLNSGKSVQDPKVTSVIVNQNGIDDPLKNKKKVEFCKTEIHFTAGEGKVKIVETDEKPPPTNRFRRRRKKLIDEEFEDDPENPDSSKNIGEVDIKVVDDMEELRGILKNRKAKPKPYHLGDNLNVINSWELKTEPEIEQSRSQPVIEFESNEKETDQHSLVSSLLDRNGYKLTSDNDICSKTTNLLDKKKYKNNSYQKDFNNTLKSTNLILKTLNLADEFDETMKVIENMKFDKSITDDKPDDKEVKPLKEFELQTKPDLILPSKIHSNPIIPVAPSRQKNLYSNTLEGQLRQLKQLYENQEACDDKISLNKNDLKKETRLDDPTSEISGSWHRVKVKKKTNPEASINVPKNNVEQITTMPTKPKIAPRIEINEPICDIFTTSNKNHSHKDSLKGMRKLRENELTFFGIKSENRMKKLDKVEKMNKAEKYDKPRINLTPQKEKNMFKLESQTIKIEKHEKPRNNLEAQKETNSFKSESQSTNRVGNYEKHRTNLADQRETINFKPETQVETVQKKTMKSIGIQVCVPDKPRIHKTVHASISKTSSSNSRKTASTDIKSRSSNSKERPKSSKRKI